MVHEFSPHVILEGPDATGKTTMARQLESLGWKYHHEGPPAGTDDLFTYYCQVLLNAKEPTVFDRLFHGELVYGPLVRGKSLITWDHVPLFDRLCRARGAVTVLCGISFREALARWNQVKRTRIELVNDE